MTEGASQRPRKNVVSISGGKDSTATALVCRALEDPASIMLTFAETDNEHPLTYEYLKYLDDCFQMPIVRLRADFARRIERKRQYVAEVWPTEGVPQDVIERALSALVPTGRDARPVHLEGPVSEPEGPVLHRRAEDGAAAELPAGPDRGWQRRLVLAGHPGRREP
jgi:Phosphoadenosine phosphosulfate reductase family